MAGLQKALGGLFRLETIDVWKVKAMPRIAYFRILLLVFLVFFHCHPCSIHSQETKSAESRLKQFYGSLTSKEFHQAWEMLSSASKTAESASHYVSRLEKSTRNLSLESATINAFRFYSLFTTVC